MRAGKAIWTGVKWMVILYLLFVFIASTLPWIPSRAAVKEAHAEQVDASAFYGEGTGPDRAALIITPRDALGVRIELLRSATESIDIVYHSIAGDQTGDAFLGEVVRAADRGVRVRILLDGKMGFSGGTKGNIRALAGHPNIECAQYNAAHLLNPWLWHATLHDKYMLVDGRLALVGGRNIGDRYFDPADYTRAVTNDQDVLIMGDAGDEASVLAALKTYMEEQWTYSAVIRIEPSKDAENQRASLLGKADVFEQEEPGFYEKPLADYLEGSVETAKITLVTNPIHTGKKEPLIGEAMRMLALNAKEEVILQSPYATGNRYLLAALSEVDAQVRVTYLTNSMASSPNYLAFSNYYAQRKQFLNTGIEIRELQSRDSIHGKSMLVDNRISVVGSYNMDDRSFYIDTENMLVIDSEAFAAILRAEMEETLSQTLAVGGNNRYIVQEDVSPLPVSILKRAGMAVTSVFTRIFQFLI